MLLMHVFLNYLMLTKLFFVATIMRGNKSKNGI